MSNVKLTEQLKNRLLGMGDKMHTTGKSVVCSTLRISQQGEDLLVEFCDYNSITGEITPLVYLRQPRCDLSKGHVLNIVPYSDENKWATITIPIKLTD